MIAEDPDAQVHGPPRGPGCPRRLDRGPDASADGRWTTVERPPGDRRRARRAPSRSPSRPAARPPTAGPDRLGPAAERLQGRSRSPPRRRPAPSRAWRGPGPKRHDPASAAHDGRPRSANPSCCAPPPRSPDDIACWRSTSTGSNKLSASSSSPSASSASATIGAISPGLVEQVRLERARAWSSRSDRVKTALRSGSSANPGGRPARTSRTPAGSRPPSAASYARFCCGDGGWKDRLSRPSSPLVGSRGLEPPRRASPSRPM